MDKSAAYLESPLILVFCIGGPTIVLLAMFVILGPHRRRQQRREREEEERNRQRVAWYTGSAAQNRDQAARRAATNPSIWDAEAQVQLEPCARTWPGDNSEETLPAYEAEQFADDRTINPRTNERTWFT